MGSPSSTNPPASPHRSRRRNARASAGIGVGMARTLVDLPEDLVLRAMELTGAPSKRAMITRAIEELVNRQAQLEMIDCVEGGGLPGLTEPDVRADARR